MWVEKEKKASENRQRKREAEEADKVEVASGVIIGRRRVSMALIGPIEGRTPKAAKWKPGN